MEKEWMQEILEKLARKNDTSPEKIKEEMESYLKDLQGGEGEEIDQRIFSQMGRGAELFEFIGRLAEEMEWEKKKEEELRSFLEGTQ